MISATTAEILTLDHHIKAAKQNVFTKNILKRILLFQIALERKYKNLTTNCIEE